MFHLYFLPSHASIASHELLIETKLKLFRKGFFLEVGCAPRKGNSNL